MASEVGKRRYCTSCGTEVIVMRPGSGEFAVQCCGVVMSAKTATAAGDVSAKEPQ